MIQERISAGLIYRAKMYAGSKMMQCPRYRRKLTVTVILLCIILICYLLCLPRDLFPHTVWSTVVVDRHGELLGARIAADGQWRFPPVNESVNVVSSEYMPDDSEEIRKADGRNTGSLPESTGNAGKEKYFKALIYFEDRWFRFHPGVNPVSIVKAAVRNMKAGYTVSGGSTITMQVIRMSRGKDRNIGQKIIEAVLATRLELRCTKDGILELYAEHAPFGGNVVGLEAASWRYFGRPSSELSWSEAAMLAVLPNSPSGIRPGKNRDKLLAKRNRLLDKLLREGVLSVEEHGLAIAEPLPDAPAPLPSLASHLVDDLAADVRTNGKYIRTGIDINLQRRVEEVVDRESSELSREGINDMAAVVMDVRSGEIIAYCGNSSPDRKRSGGNVDVARSPRSSGSILKPFLYCDVLRDGILLPYSLIPDTPMNINGFSPQNFNLSYDGAVPASEALSRSLNVPSVHMLKSYGVRRFLEDLKDRGFTSFDRSASDYGLSLILGGGECRLDQVTSAYASLARDYLYKGDRQVDRPSIWYTLEALKDVNRPDEIDWHIIRSVRKVAWKTGTSYGYRDAWACGADPAFAVGVWAGNASGVGAPVLLGARTAGPVMFEIFNLLPSRSPYSEPYGYDWFQAPGYTDGVHAEVCRKSGFLAGQYCMEKDTLLLPRKALLTGKCPYHIKENGQIIFRLTPAMEWFYRKRHPEYGQDAVKSGHSGTSARPMEFIYPENGSKITIPLQLDGTPGEIVLNLAHHDKDATVYWHMDNDYIGETRFIHQIRVRPSPGRHTITVVDNAANSLTISIVIS